MLVVAVEEVVVDVLQLLLLLVLLLFVLPLLLVFVVVCGPRALMLDVPKLETVDPGAVPADW